MRYKFVDSPAIPDPAIIEKYQDFNLLLKRYSHMGNNSALKGVDILSSVITIVLLSYILFPRSLSESGGEKIEISSALIDTKVESLNIPPTPSPDIFNNPDSISGSKKKANRKRGEVKKGEKEQQKPNQPPVFIAAQPIRGFDYLYQYFNDSLKYPGEALNTEITGEIIIEFSVMPDNSIREIEITQSLDPAFDEEAKRLILEMPEWKSATINGKPIKSRISLPLLFNSNSSKKN